MSRSSPWGCLSDITILVADVRNYTLFSEQLPIFRLSAVMSRLFRSATEVVEASGGTVDKFIGDAVMARWIVEEAASVGDTVLAALWCSVDLNRCIQEINRAFPNLPFPLTIGVGINSGQAALGNVDLHNRRNFTALGDSVNFAFRLEALTQKLGRSVVIGSDAYHHLPEKIWKRRTQSVTVKGKDAPIAVCVANFDELNEFLPPRTPSPWGSSSAHAFDAGRSASVTRRLGA